MVSFVTESLKINEIEDLKVSMLSQANIISDQIEPIFLGIQNENTFNYVVSIVKKNSLEINSRIFLLNMRGDVVVDSHDTLSNKNYKNINEIALALKGEGASEIYNNETRGEKVVYTAVPILDKNGVVGVVFLSTPANDLFEDISIFLRNLIVLCLVGLLITGIIGFAFADILSSPIEDITNYVRDITRGKHDQRINVSGNDEIANLCNAFNLMSVKLDQVDDQRKMFVSNVSHELRTPMASIKILCESLLLQDKVDEDVYKEFLTDINNEVDRLNNIIDSLLYLVNLEKKELELNYDTTYLNYLMLNVIKKMKPLANKKNISIEFEAEEKVQIDADREKLEQCLINIIGNSIKYTENNGKVSIFLFRERNGYVKITIEDNGIGIPKNRIEHIFDRFYRVDEARARKSGGSGLGLSIAQQIINLHQGMIKVESEVNVGTKMEIVLPEKMDI